MASYAKLRMKQWNGSEVSVIRLSREKGLSMGQRIHAIHLLVTITLDVCLWSYVKCTRPQMIGDLKKKHRTRIS